MINTFEKNKQTIISYNQQNVIFLLHKNVS